MITSHIVLVLPSKQINTNDLPTTRNTHKPAAGGPHQQHQISTKRGVPPQRISSVPSGEPKENRRAYLSPCRSLRERGSEWGRAAEREGRKGRNGKGGPSGTETHHTAKGSPERGGALVG